MQPLFTNEKSARRAQWILLAALVVATTVARLWIVAHFPEPDGDAKGHLGIARALMRDPFNVAAHWVWPPGYHYLLAALLELGLDGQGVRFVDCALAAAIPFAVFGYARATLDPRQASSPAPFLAATLCAVMPMVNLLGTSAEPGTVFTLLVLGAAWSIDTEKFAAAGALLAVASMVRYEACGAVFFLAGLRALGSVATRWRCAPAFFARLSKLPLALFVPGLVAIAAWLLAQRLGEGSFLASLRELFRYTRVQRASFDHADFWRTLLWFPVIEPYYVFGLTIPLFFLGIRRAARAGFLVPLGVYLFLVASYLTKGAAGHARYYASLTPFECIGAAYGATLLGERFPRAPRAVYALAFAHVAWLLVETGKWTFHFHL